MRLRTNILLLIGIILITGCKTTMQTATTAVEKSHTTTENNIVSTTSQEHLIGISELFTDNSKDSVLTSIVSETLSKPDSTGKQYVTTRTTTSKRQYNNANVSFKSNVTDLNNTVNQFLDKSKSTTDKTTVVKEKSKTTVSGTAIYKYIIIAFIILSAAGYLLWKFKIVKL